MAAKPLAIEMRLTKAEGGLVELLNYVARHNARLLVERPDLPLLYESGVVYEREEREVWCDFLATLEQGYEDCDGLSAARAGELMAWGWEAMTPEDGGWELAQVLRPARVPAWVFLRTRGAKGQPNLYHCLVLYRIGETYWLDDPSARLGMFRRRYHPYNTAQAFTFMEPGDFELRGARA